ncbi:uncharacterized protein LOC141910561 [Tubulanus polymorphus]|uniref:uncharacterized protein LOC141910561 n=1 Tax=Tubulanus polymorphus TaxID=672921 RepID=UPI003DA6BFA1
MSINALLIKPYNGILNKVRGMNIDVGSDARQFIGTLNDILGMGSEFHRAVRSIAGGKPVVQSTTAGDGDASKAVDRDKQTCTMTEKKYTGSWWQIDIGENQMVNAVQILLNANVEIPREDGVYRRVIGQCTGNPITETLEDFAACLKRCNEMGKECVAVSALPYEVTDCHFYKSCNEMSKNYKIITYQQINFVPPKKTTKTDAVTVFDFLYNNAAVVMSISAPVAPASVAMVVLKSIFLTFPTEQKMSVWDEIKALVQSAIATKLTSHNEDAMAAKLGAVVKRISELSDSSQYTTKFRLEELSKLATTLNTFKHRYDLERFEEIAFDVEILSGIPSFCLVYITLVKELNRLGDPVWKNNWFYDLEIFMKSMTEIVESTAFETFKDRFGARTMAPTILENGLKGSYYELEDHVTKSTIHAPFEDFKQLHRIAGETEMLINALLIKPYNGILDKVRAMNIDVGNDARRFVGNMDDALGKGSGFEWKGKMYHSLCQVPCRKWPGKDYLYCFAKHPPKMHRRRRRASYGLGIKYGTSSRVNIIEQRCFFPWLKGSRVVTKVTNV